MIRRKVDLIGKVRVWNNVEQHVISIDGGRYVKTVRVRVGRIKTTYSRRKIKCCGRMWVAGRIDHVDTVD